MGSAVVEGWKRGGAAGRRERHQTTDADLVLAALEGSEQACRRLVRRFERPIFGLIVRMVRDPRLAEDLAQETFLKAFQHLDRYDPQRRLASWLFKIAHNTTLDHLRRRQPATQPLEASDADTQETWDALAAPEVDSPHGHAVGSQLAGAVGEALQQLRPEYREILLLRFQEGLGYQEIVQVTGQALGTVKIHLHRARKQLAAALATRGWRLPQPWRP